MKRTMAIILCAGWSAAAQAEPLTPAEALGLAEGFGFRLINSASDSCWTNVSAVEAQTAEQIGVAGFSVVRNPEFADFSRPYMEITVFGERAGEGACFAVLTFNVLVPHLHDAEYGVISANILLHDRAAHVRGTPDVNSAVYQVVDGFVGETLALAIQARRRAAGDDGEAGG